MFRLFDFPAGDFKNRFFWAACLSLGLALLLALGACSSDLPIGPTTTPTATPPPPATATLAPTPSATPQPPLVILWAPDGADAQIVAGLQTSLAQLANQDDLRFQSISGSDNPDLALPVRIVVAVSPGPELQKLASATPGTQFLVIAGDSSLEAGKNITLLGGQGAPADQLGFLAGYLAAAVTQDWRVGVISQADSGPELAAQAAFINGAVFFCGLCRPSYPPYVQYPVYAQLPVGAGQAEGQNIVDSLVSQGVETVYVTPGATSEALLGYLAEKGVHIIGSAPPAQAVQDDWVATVTTDWTAAVKDAWPSLLNGAGGQELNVPIVVENANAALFSPGRQQLVDETRQELLAGRIDTGVNPQTGQRTQ